MKINVLLYRDILFLLIIYIFFESCRPGRNHDKIWVSPVPGRDTAYGVYLFRNTYEITELNTSLIINVSADNRYKFFINGHQIGSGPARSDLVHWQYDTYDIGPFLERGKNVLAAVVWNAGEGRPLAQISDRTAFYMLCPEMPSLSTGNGNWRVSGNPAYQPVPFGIMDLGDYYVCGPGDSIDMKKYPSGWLDKEYNDSGWVIPYIIPDEEEKWKLTERRMPLLEHKVEQSPSFVRITGNNINNPDNIPGFPIILPADGKYALLLDQKYLTAGYPELLISKGNGSIIRITYAEALFDKRGRKGDRNDTEDKNIHGYYDVVLPDGSDEQTFTSLWLRTFRFVELDIQTGSEPLIINNFFNHFSAYPFHLDAKFETDNPVTGSIMEVGWRTLRLCAGETYFDCPYYEQLQYAGDTRVQVLITYALSKDDRLARNAMLQLWHSMQPEGITLSRYPASQDQKIPGFSLYWISMIYDYMMYRNDPDFLEQFLPAVEKIMDYFDRFTNDKDMLGPMNHGEFVGGLPEYWYFFDWSGGFDRGIPQGAYDNSSSVITLHYVYTLQQAAGIMKFFGRKDLGDKYQTYAERLKNGVMKHCFDTKRGLIAQTPDKQQFSQHANVLGILTDAFKKEMQPDIIQKILNDETLIKCSMYYQFYLHRAMDKAGMGDRYLDMLGDWYRALENGLTTFPEKEGNTRSDCHAWNASPCYEFFTTIAGIEPANPGFKTVHIHPHFGKLNKIYAEMPHPLGSIKIILEKTTANGLFGTIELPVDIYGQLFWGKTIFDLVPGKKEIHLRGSVL